MNTRAFWSSRLFAISAGVTICIVIGAVSSCAPPHQQDSAKKLATATTVKPVVISSTAATISVPKSTAASTSARPSGSTTPRTSSKTTTSAAKPTTKTSTATSTSKSSVNTTTTRKRPYTTATAIQVEPEPIDLVPTAKQPGVIDCISPAVIKPATLHISCVDETDIVKDIKWTTWSEQTATGTGKRVKQGEDPETVTIKLSDPQKSNFGVIFETILVNGFPVTGLSPTTESGY